MKQNISHAGGANECTVTILFVAAFFLRYKALYQNCSGDARFSHGASIARLLKRASSVSDMSSGVCSMTLLIHVGNLLVHVAKCSYMSPSATPATQKAAATTAAPENPARHQSQPSAIRATPATQSDDPCRQVPRLPRKAPHLPHKVNVDVTKRHACHAKLPRETADKLCVQVPRLPRETKVDVSKHHACHAKCSYMSPSATSATQKAAATTTTPENPARHQSQPSAIRATPAP